MKFRPLILILTALVLSGCGQIWSTNYELMINPVVGEGWRVERVEVDVPRTLVVTEANSYAPEADILWQEPYTGDRYAQVEEIMREAAELGVARLRGARPVVFHIEVERFHAITERTRVWTYKSGVHNITFNAWFTDAETGEEITPPIRIMADLVAYSGEDSRRARKVGQTQQVRITNHVARTIDGWVGTGPDNRGSFRRRGR